MILRWILRQKEGKTALMMQFYLAVFLIMKMSFMILKKLLTGKHNLFCKKA